MAALMAVDAPVPGVAVRAQPVESIGAGSARTVEVPHGDEKRL